MGRAATGGARRVEQGQAGLFLPDNIQTPPRTRRVRAAAARRSPPAPRDPPSSAVGRARCGREAGARARWKRGEGAEDKHRARPRRAGRSLAQSARARFAAPRALDRFGGREKRLRFAKDFDASQYYYNREGSSLSAVRASTAS